MLNNMDANKPKLLRGYEKYLEKEAKNDRVFTSPEYGDRVHQHYKGLMLKKIGMTREIQRSLWRKALPLYKGENNEG